METSNNLFMIIGKLFYAIAAVDKTVHPLEVESLKQIIGERSVHANPVEIMNSFNISLHDKMPAYVAFEEFESYKKRHEHEFTPEIKKWIWQIADRITYSFAGKNKSEVIILSKLKKCLEQ